MSGASSSLSPAAGVPPAGNVVLLFKAKASPDADLALSLESLLRKRGLRVLIDRHLAVGLTWAREFEEQILQADLVVVLVSAASAESELLAYELEVAVQLAGERGGVPQILPVRVFYRGPLSETLAGLLHPIEFEWDPEAERFVSRLVLWRSPADDAAVAGLIEERLASLAQARRSPAPPDVLAAPRPVPPLEPLGGAVALESRFYVERPTDRTFRNAVGDRDSLVLIKGARQMGKTSLLARGLRQAREATARVVLTDFQKLQVAHFASLPTFYLALTELIADQLHLDLPDPERFSRNPNAAFERFWHGALETLQQPVLWAMDEFDRLFTCPFGAEVCGLLRSWHNARALDPQLPWRQLTIAIAYATEAHLFIADLNQSPFNVGTRLTLEDFSLAELTDLNERYGRPLRQETELARLRELLGGQPYLVRCAMNEMALHHEGLERIEHLVGLEESVFGEHLRRLLYSLSRDRAVAGAVRQLLLEGTPPPVELFHRLRSAGVLVGASPNEARPRCGLYERFLRRHLSERAA
jgi:hypothetical protein